MMVQPRARARTNRVHHARTQHSIVHIAYEALFQRRQSYA